MTRGTGFLVGPDLMMTAAHVIDGLVDQNDAATNGSEDRIEAVFHNQLEAEGTWPIRTRVAREWLLCRSRPNGRPPRLNLDDPDAAATCLDFALIRLAEPIGARIGFIDILNPPRPIRRTRLAIIGYPGGSDCQSDDHQIIQYEREIHRIRHGTNAIEGMSGSPCINESGRILALHEGAVTVANPPDEYNRAVVLEAIRAKLKAATGGDPVIVEPSAFWQIADPAALAAWVTAGTAIFVMNDAARRAWLDRVARFDPANAGPGSPADALHPVFRREEFQTWITQTRTGDRSERVALVTGEDASGKSFTISILRARLRLSGEPVIALPQETAWDPDMGAILAQMAQALSLPAPALDVGGFRPLAGRLSRDILPDFMDHVRELLTMAQGGARRRAWLAVDFGRDALVTSELAALWKQIMIEMQKEVSLRLILIGLSQRRAVEFRQAAGGREAVFLDSIRPVSFDDFWIYASHVIRAVRPSDNPDAYLNQVMPLWPNDMDALTTAEGRTVEAVRLALEFRSSLITA